MFEIEEAKREAAPVLVAFLGQSGSGKTLSALLFSRGLVGPSGKIVLIDTEGRRSLVYADNPDVGGFDYIDFIPPYSSDRFREATKAAIASGADCIVIDSASHEHEGESGFLDYADQEEKRIGGRGAARSKWIRAKGSRNRFIRTMTSAPCHVVLCIRQKQIVDMDVKPAMKILKPVCGEDLLFEMKLVIELETETHKTRFTKVPLPFQQHIREGEMIRVEHGELLLQEANKGEARDSATDRMIAELKETAEGGFDVAKNAFVAAWENGSPAEKAALEKHKPEILRIANQAEAKADSPPPAGEFGDKPADPEPENNDVGNFGDTPNV